MNYTTELSTEECLRRLRAHAGRSMWTRWEEGTICAKVRGDRFRLFAWGPVNVRNSFAPFFYGRLEEAAGKTHIRGSFRLHPLTQAFLSVWFGGLLLMAVFLAWHPVGSPGHPPARSHYEFLGPLAMAGAGLLFLRFGRWLARRQMERIGGFLVHEMKARSCAEAEVRSSSDGRLV